MSTGPVSGGGFPNWYNFEDKWQFRNDTSIQTGRHAWKFGVDYAYLPKHGGIYGPGSPGSISFFHDPSIILSNSNGLYPQGLQTPGIVRAITLTGEPIGNYDSYGSWTFSGYLQDDWRIGSRLTLNLGLRYDVYEHMNQGDNRFAENRTYKVLRDIGHPMGGLPQTDTDNFGPRVGMAWDIRGDGSRVMRGSFGRYFTMGIKNSYYLAAIQDKPTLFLTQNRTNTAIGQGALAGYIYGVTPLPPVPKDITEFPRNGNNVGAWYDPALKDFETDQFAVGYSHVLAQNTVIAVDYSRYNGRKGWRTLNINPLLDHDGNPATARIRPLAADTQRVYDDPTLMGPVNIIASVNDGTYDEMVVHFEKRFGDGDGDPRRLRARLRRRHGRRDRRRRAAGLGGPADSKHDRRRHLRAVGVRSDRVRRAAPRHAERRAADRLGLRALADARRGVGAPVHAEPDAQPERGRQPARAVPGRQQRRRGIRRRSGAVRGEQRARPAAVQHQRADHEELHVQQHAAPRRVRRALQPDEPSAVRQPARRQPAGADDLQPAGRISGRCRRGVDAAEFVPGAVRRADVLLDEDAKEAEDADRAQSAQPVCVP